MLSSILNSWSDDLLLFTEWQGDITVAAGDTVRFYAAICDETGALRNNTYKNFTGASLTVTAINF